MRTTRRIIPFALLSGLLLSCGSEHRLARVRISQPGVREATTDTACKVPEQIAWTDDKGERHIVTRAEKDSVTGEEITSVELSEITVMARSKQVAERNGKGKHVLDSELTNKLVKEAFAEIPRISLVPGLSVVTRTQIAPPTLAVAVATTQLPS